MSGCFRLRFCLHKLFLPCGQCSLHKTSEILNVLKVLLNEYAGNVWHHSAAGLETVKQNCSQHIGCIPKILLNSDNVDFFFSFRASPGGSEEHGSPEVCNVQILRNQASVVQFKLMSLFWSFYYHTNYNKHHTQKKASKVSSDLN